VPRHGRRRTNPTQVRTEQRTDRDEREHGGDERKLDRDGREHDGERRECGGDERELDRNDCECSEGKRAYDGTGRDDRSGDGLCDRADDHRTTHADAKWECCKKCDRTKNN